MDDKYKIKVHSWDINVKIKQDKKTKGFAIYEMDISDRLWTWRLARWYVIKMLSPLWCIGLAGNGFKGYFAHKLPLNRQPFKSLVFRYLHVTHTYWHKDDGWRRGGLIVRQVSLTHMQTYYFLFSDNNNNSSKQTMTNLWTTIWQIYRYITRRPWW